MSGCNIVDLNVVHLSNNKSIYYNISRSPSENAYYLAKKGTCILQGTSKDIQLHTAKLGINRFFKQSFRLYSCKIDVQGEKC